MKSFIKWLKSSKSDFILWLVLIILINLVGSRAFFRIDTTKTQSYSLTKTSEILVNTLENPLSIKLFFSKNLPSPHNTTAQYVRDMLMEYEGSANDYFSWEEYDMDDLENESIAREYGLGQIQIQEVKDNEVGFKNVWMGLAITYADRIEVIDGLATSDGLEYQLTTKMSSMINDVSSLAGITDDIQLRLYLSDALSDFNIDGFDQIELSVLNAFSVVNAKNMNKISYKVVNPTESEAPALAEKYGIQLLEWEEKDGSIGSGVIGLVLEQGEKSRVVPLEMTNQLFMGYVIAGLETLEESLFESLRSLVSKSITIGYVTGHEEASLYDAQAAGNLGNIAAQLYELREINLQEETIPASMSTLVINGPKTAFTDAELYAIDQFVLRGGNLALFVDSFNVLYDEQAAMYGQQSAPQYFPVDTGLEKLLAKYGVEIEDAYAFDMHSYSQPDQQMGELNFYYIPVVHQDSMNKENAISANLAYVFFPEVSPVTITIPETDENRKATVLATTSDEAWTQSENILLHPLYIAPPSNPADFTKKNLSVLVEGTFDSAFDSALTAETEGTFATNSHLKSSVQSSKIFVVGTSKITTGMVIDEQGTTPSSFFVMNALDVLNGSEDFARMRSRNISYNVLTEINPTAQKFATYFNMIGIPLAVVVCGIIVWFQRNKRRKAIYALYNSEESEAENE